jgi:hypothetical protein
MIVLRVNGRDLAPYVVAAPADSEFDPVDADRIEPQFSGAPAFAEGAAFTGDATDNREWTIPLVLDAADRAALHSLIRDINADLVQGAPVEFASDEADDSTFFSLETGRLDVHYQFMLTGVHNTTRAVLRLWTIPHGHTGTARTVASLAATGAVEFPATGILGDIDALANIEVRVGSKVASNGRIVGYGVHRSASFAGIRGPSAPEFVAQSGATVRGYSGAVGSQALAIPVSPTGASGVALTSFLAPPGGHVGRHRLFGVMRSRLNRPVTLYARDRFGAILGPTTAASQTDATKWGLVDLGEVQVPRGGSEGIPTQYVELVGGGASGAAVVASPALEVNRLIYMPLGEAPGLLRTRGAGGDSLLYADSFARFADLPVGNLLQTQPNAEIGDAAWAKTAGDLANSNDRMVPAASQNFTANASAFYSLASGARHTDARAEVKTALSAGASAGVASSAIELWVKQINASEGMYARLDFTPSHALRIYSATGAATIVLASAVGASVAAAASGFYAGNPLILGAQVLGDALTAFVGTSPVGAASVSVSNAFFTFRGWPALKMNSGSNIPAAFLTADDFRYLGLSAGASDIAPRQWFRFESHPKNRAIQSNASVFTADREAEFRGNNPQAPPVGSPGASGPARAVVFSGDPDDFQGNDLLDVRVDATERWRFLR